ncbi:MAG: LuxR family transcriptional regulator [Firmicutes bacterium]|nr:LuxR family transcriptional regulator [Bacillota bacterium]
MAGGENSRFSYIQLDERRLSIIVFSLFFAWLLAFPFEGQVLYALADRVQIDPHAMIFGAIASHVVGLFGCGFLIKTRQAAKRLMRFSMVFCIVGTGVFFFHPSVLWNIVLIASSLLASGCVAAWGFFLRSGTPPNQRIKTVADGLIFSNILMILLNMTAVHLSPYAGLGLSMFLIGGAMLFAARLPAAVPAVLPDRPKQPISIVKPLVFLCLFITVITINSGLMYQVINPAFAHLEWLTSWYWAIPYIVALYIMKNLPRKTNRTYILYVAIAMIGFSFIGFMILDHSAGSYLVVNTLMLGACGVYDLFWWSILGEMLDFDQNPAKVLGVGLSANVLGVLIGGLIGSAIVASDLPNYNSSVLALAVVCVTLTILPLLHRHLSALLTDHAYLTVVSEMSPAEQTSMVDRIVLAGRLTERENEIAALLVKGKTYRMIAGELHLSENTVKTHIKNIYSKCGIQSRTELINLMLEPESTGHK